MATLWHCLNESSRECLIAYQRRRWPRSKMTPLPITRDIEVRGVLESSEEIGRLMTMPKLRGAE